MTATGLRTWLLVLAASLSAALAAPASAETLSFKASLQPVQGANSKATGTLTADYSTDTKKLLWHGNYGGISTYAIAANLHGPAGAGENAGIAVRLRNIDSPFEGFAILSDKQAADLIAGRWYILVRTAAYPNGELRGQIERAK